MLKISNKNISKKESITVDFLFSNLRSRHHLLLFTEDIGLENLIVEENLNRPGLALGGFLDLFIPTRIQVFGNTEMSFIYRLDQEERYNALKKIYEYNIPCILVTDNNKPTPEMLQLSYEYNIPILGTEIPTTRAISIITDFLEDQFAPRVTLHGSFVDVYGVGMLFVGKSGIGKSEVSLALIEKGHRLVADDVVILTKKREGVIIGTGTELVKHFMEIRGVGLIDVRSIFGVRAIRFQKRLEMIIELETWDENTSYTRTGIDDVFFDFLGVQIPFMKLPIVPGKNLAVIAEVIALNYLLKHYGYDAAKVFQKRLEYYLSSQQNYNSRNIEYFERDFE
ncbi:MAG TPA: HPr(Ser) kinase/phosphatase [Ignavibacteriales bacterium]|nr:HPr(Ser) kinase/phosphatase [Ignavibacteriales bacterium]